MYFGNSQVEARVEELRDAWELKSIVAHKKRQGYGTRLMEVICNAADKEGVDIHLISRPVGADSMSATDLRRFYEKFGFESYPGKGPQALNNMVRKAK